MRTSRYHLALLWAQLCTGHTLPSTTPRPILSTRDSVECPEDIGAAPWACSFDACGGEDAANAGHCTNANAAGIQCQCSTDDSAAPSETVVTETVSGQTVVATYALETIASFSGLREGMTTTISHTTTATDGSIGIETEVAVIMAGGVAWVLAGAAGDAAAVEAGLEAPETTGDDSSEFTCPDPKTKCSDCSGVGGMCTTGDAAGCTCEGSVCPDQKPQCTDCDGQDGKCQGGDSDGCNCVEECPKGRNTPFCDTCGGNAGSSTGASTCAGSEDDDNRFKGCICMDKKRAHSAGYEHSLTDEQVQAVFAKLSSITEDSFATDPQNIEAVCQTTGPTAPQRDEDGSPNVASSIEQWCSDMDGQTVTKAPDGVDTVFQMTKYLGHSYWLSATNWYTAPDFNKCTNTATIRKSECVDSLNYAMSTCDPDSGVTHGAAFPGECIWYNITLDASQIEGSPPWNPLPDSAIGGDCDKNNVSGLSSGQFKNLYPQFCDAVDGDNPLSRDYNQDDYPDTSAKRLFRRSPPPTKPQQIYGHDWTFHFEWSGGNGDSCRKSCSESFASLAKSGCSTLGSEQDSMAASGLLDAGCGTYSYEITTPAAISVQCDVAAANIGDAQSVGYSVAQLEDAAGQFCADRTVVVTNPPLRQFTQDSSKETPSTDSIRYTYGDMILDLTVQFADTLQLNGGNWKLDQCSFTDKNITMADYQEDCLKGFRAAMNECNTDTTTDKRNSFAVEHHAGYGCVYYQIAAYPS